MLHSATISTNRLPRNREIFRNNCRCGENLENVEHDVPLMTSGDPLEYFEIECDEGETDCTKCCACAKPCGHLMCIFCIEDECRKCDTKTDSKFSILSEPCFVKILFCCQLILRVSSILVQILDVFWSILAFQIFFS